MKPSLLTAGQFAKLARTTKRTVLWYEQAGILSPVTVADNGYRLYEPRQILDFQIISLLRHLDFSLEEIQSHISGGQSLMALFDAKKADIGRQLVQLQRIYHDLESYSASLVASELLVSPNIKNVPAFDIYYIPVIAPYAAIKELGSQLAGKFEALPADAVFLTIFEDQQYQPQAAAMRIGVVKQPGMRLKPDAHEVLTATIPAYKALVHVHGGDGSLLSLLWTEFGKYRRAHKLKPAAHTDFYELELYPVKGPGQPLEFEMHLPIASA